MAIRTMLTMALALLAPGCAWVSLERGAEAVAVRSTEQAGECRRLGKTHTRTLERVGPFPRRQAPVEQELERLARNEAVAMGGNAVAPLDAEHDGERTFAIYDCP